MKQCTKCLAEKSLELFSFKSRQTGKRLAWCKSCMKVYDANHYQKNKKHRHEIKYANREKIRRFLTQYLREHPCAVCNEDDIVVLEFDHIDPKTKKFDIGKSVSGYSIQSILEEIKKCQVLCANCHRRRTAKQRGWYKNLPSSSNGKDTTPRTLRSGFKSL